MTAEQFRRLALALPEAIEAPHFQYTSFRAGGRIFATMPPEGTHAHLFVADDQRDLALAMDTECLEPLLWGQKVVGVRVTLAAAPAATVKRLLLQAHAHRTKPAVRKTARPKRAAKKAAN